MLVGSGCQQPKPEAPKEEAVSFEQRVKCTELGQRYQQEDQTDKNAVYMESNYGYSKGRKTCLYRGGFLLAGKTTTYVVDLLTNVTIGETITEKDAQVYTEGDTSLLDKAKFTSEIK
ncbi:MAG: hypothetical protein RL272_936 [Candidatus Parcubacteria bacterium]